MRGRTTRSLRVVLVLLSLAALLVPGPAAAITIGVATDAIDYVRPGDVWRFRRGTAPPSAPAAAWKEIDFVDAAWENGPSGFGFGDDDDATVLNDMAGSYLTVYIRKELALEGPPPDLPLELVIDYDDGFVAYLNGAEVARREIDTDPVDYQTPASSHEAGTPEVIALGSAADLLLPGKNVLAIEGHNTSLESGDLTLLPSLRLAGNVVQDGSTWITGSGASTLMGTTTSPAAAAVRVNGTAASFNAATREWQAAVTLAAGPNRFTAEALDAGGAVLETAAIDVVFVPPSARVTGSLTQDTTWSGAVIVEGTLTVPAGIRLAIAPGTWVALEGAASIVVRGRFLADGSEAMPIRLTRHLTGPPWRQLRFVKAEEARLRHCIVEYADCEGDHREYYTEGPRNYREAVLALACHLDIEDCLFQKLPNAGAAAEGDAIAIIADDPDDPGTTTANVRRSQFLAIGQGVHARFSHVLVEDCFFTGKRGDNDDVDLWGESDPPPMVLNNLFLDPEHDDTINPTRCSAVIAGNIVAGTDDHGIVLRDAGSPIVFNNVIYDCANGGIAIENSCSALLINNTIADCGRGLRLFDLGRWDAPYFLNPGGGTATVINCVIWDCPEPITLEDSSNTTIADRGSHVTVIHSDIQGGQAGVSVGGSQSTVTWGAGNIDADPRFVDVATRDYRLREGSPAIDAGTLEQAPPADLAGAARPCGNAVDMGAYELCAGAPVAFRRGDVNSDGVEDISDAVFQILYLFAGGRAPTCLEAADTDDDGNPQLGDAIYLLGFLFRGGEPPPAPFPGCGSEPEGESLGCVAYGGCG